MRLRLAVLIVLIASASHAQTVTYFRVSGVAWGIAVGPDGNLWFPTTKGVAKMTTSGLITTYPTSTAPTLRSMITAGPDGRMWFTLRDRIDAVTMDGTVTEFPLPAEVFPMGIASGSDGRIWFGYGSGVGAMTPAGRIALFSTGNPRSSIFEMAAGPDGNVWFVEFPENSIGRVKPNGKITHFSIYPPACCGPSSIASSKDGSLWLAFNQGSSIAQVSTQGGISLVPLNQRAVVVRDGPAAKIWFGTEQFGIGTPAAIGRVSESGEVQVIELPLEVPMVMDMVIGPDGNMWATLYPTPHTCVAPCPPSDPTPPLGIARVNLVPQPLRHRAVH